MKFIIMCCLLIIGGGGFLTKPAYAFSCTSNGIAIGGTGVFTVPVDITLNKNTTEIQLTDLSTYTSCSGYLGWQGPGGPAANDALRTYGSSSFSSVFSSMGFTGYAILPSGQFDFPLPTGKCVWPDGNCTYTSGTNLTTSPIYIKIGMKKVSTETPTGRIIPAGTEIARFTLEQRGTLGGAPPSWGLGIKTWVFTLKNPLIIPSYSCTLNNANQTVSLAPVMKGNIINNGVGRYPIATPFNLNLSCDPLTTVSVQFDGAAMKNKSDVLANDGDIEDSVGIQMQYNNSPVVLGNKMLVISNAKAQESILLQAYYYFNGGNLSTGSIKAVSTVTLTYN